MGSKRDIFVTLAGLLLGAQPASAIVTVESFINQIEDIGPCDLPNGINDKCGFTEVTDLSLLNAFMDGRGAHEEVGLVRFTAERGQIGGFQLDDLPLCTDGAANDDSSDWDVPDRFFTCTEAVTGGCSPGGVSRDDSISSCHLAPDITGRLDSLSCSDYFGPGYTGNAAGATYGCSLADFDDPNTDHEDYVFFNYMACHPNADCFQPDPLQPVNSAGGCDMGLPGPFGLTSDQILGGVPQEDIWISGTILAMRLPFGIRLANTVYPGVMLNGTRQFDFNDPDLSPRMNAALNPSIPDEDRIAWPAMIYRHEANHVVPTPEQLAEGIIPDCGDLGPDPETYEPETAGQFGQWRSKICKAQYSGNDAVLVFIPDTLTDRETTPDSTSRFVLSDALTDAAGIRPLSRESVQGCFRGDDPVLGACAPAFARLGVAAPPCDYETTVMMDVRGSFPALRPRSPFVLDLPIRFTLQVPAFSQTQFTQPNPSIGRVTGRGGSMNRLALEPDPGMHAYCDGAGLCPEGDYHLFNVEGSLTLTEPYANAIRVVTGNPDHATTLACHLNQADSVDFIVMDDAPASETCPDYLLAGPDAVGLESVILPPYLGLDGMVEADSRTPDGFAYRFISPSEPYQDRDLELTLYGFQLRVRKDAEWLLEGRGCVTMDCTLTLPPTQSLNHECLAGDSEPGCEKHMPGSPGTRTWTGLPIACLGPGWHSPGPPEVCYAGCVSDLQCGFGDICRGIGYCNDEGLCDLKDWLECSDHDKCNGEETCDPDLGCIAGTPLACDNGNPCDGVESCSPIYGCRSGEPLVCDDHDACNGLEFCDPVLGCVPGEVALCGNANVCDGIEWCDPAEGCIEGEPLVCDDGDPCNGVETCDPYLGCENGAPLACDDDDDDDSTAANDDDDTEVGDNDGGGSGCSCRAVDGPADWSGLQLMTLALAGIAWLRRERRCPA